MKVKFLIFVLGLSSLAYLSFLINTETSFFHLKNISISLKSPMYKTLKDKNQDVKKDYLKELSAYKNQSLFDLPLKEIKNKINSHPKIAQVVIYRKWPQTLEIQIIPHKPEALWVKNFGKTLVPVSDTGELLPAIKPNEFLDLPLLSGKSFETLENRLKALEFLSLFKNNKHLKQKHISEISYDDSKGIFISASFWSLKVNFGFDSYEKKVKRLEIILNYLVEKSLKATSIDMQYNEKAFVKIHKNKTSKKTS